MEQNKGKKPLSIFDPFIAIYSIWCSDLRGIYDLPEIVRAHVDLHVALRILRKSLDKQKLEFRKFELKIERLEALPTDLSEKEFKSLTDNIFK